MNFKFFLCCCTAALLAVALGFGAAYVTGSTLAGVAVSSLGAALGAFAVGRALWGGAVSHAADVVSAIAAKPTDVVTTDDSTLEPLFARLDDLRKAYKNDKEYKDGILRGLPMPYLLVDTKERALSTNRACLTMLEIDDSIESCMGKTLAELFYNDPTRKTAVGKSIATGECFKNLEVTIGGHKGGKVNVLAVADSLLARGARGVVMFNRFFEPDIDVERMTFVNGDPFSEPAELRNVLRSTALCAHALPQLDIAVSTGVETSLFTTSGEAPG